MIQKGLRMQKDLDNTEGSYLRDVLEEIPANILER